MSTNPNNAVGTNAAYDGRTSVKAFNDGIGAYSRGILSGWACSPNTGMTVSLGGDGNTRDIAIAEDVAGNKITVNNISESPISVTMSAAPSTNSRIDLIVAYVDNPPQGSATSVDNPGACGLITVDGTAAADPVAPNDSAIRTAITADGASGSTAYYVVLATITIASGTTDLTSDNIANGTNAELSAGNVGFLTYNTELTGASGIGTSGATLMTWNVPKTGKWFFCAVADFNLLGNEVGDASFSLINGSATIQTIFFDNRAKDYFFGGASLMTIASCEEGDTISITAKINEGGSTMDLSSDPHRSNFLAIYLGQ